MPDRDLPTGWMRALRTLGGVAYLVVIGLGVSGALLSPASVIGAVGEPLTLWWSTLAIVGGVLGAIAVAIDNYRLEVLATWPSAIGSLVYAGSIWIIMLNGHPTRLPQVMVITLAGVMLIRRGVSLLAHSAKLRKLHIASTGGGEARCG